MDFVTIHPFDTNCQANVWTDEKMAPPVCVGNSTSKLCNTDGITFLNMTSPPRNNLPQIRKGEKCIPGKYYKMSCNKCQCTEKFTLLCSKTACVDHNFKRMKDDNKKSRPNLRASSSLPVLPKGICVPGRMYRRGCKKCFCNYLKKAVCSQIKKGACTKTTDGSPTPILSPLDVRPPFTREEMKTLHVLNSASQKCQSGHSYKVNCNNCICTENNNLLCTKQLCLSFDDINRVEAADRSGKKCSGDGNLTLDVPCIQCKCVKGKTACIRIEGCVEIRTKLSKGSNDTLKMQIDPIKDICTPEAIYTDHCNKCYCQEDSSLRCTQKTCLNYAQSKALDEQFKKLTAQGL